VTSTTMSLSWSLITRSGFFRSPPTFTAGSIKVKNLRGSLSAMKYLLSYTTQYFPYHLLLPSGRPQIGGIGIILVLFPFHDISASIGARI
jgi:hypothetical protein